jgi:phosphoglycolate phosphatase
LTALVHRRNPLRWLLWDIDGTLVRFRGESSDKHAAAVEALFGGASPRGLRTAGMTDREIVSAILDAQGITAEPSDVDAALHILDRLSSQEMTTDHVVALDGVETALASMAATGWTNGLLTGNTPRRARTKLEAAGLWHAFERGGGFFGDRHGDRFSLAAEGGSARDSDPEALIVIVGDTPLDIRAGRAASLVVIAVATGKFSADELAEFEPDLLLADLATGVPDLLRFLSTLG